MAKVTLDVEEKNLKIVLNILDNLKDGLIKNISTNKQYQTAKPISSSLDKTVKKTTSNSKYLSPEEFKNRIKGN